jgi:hypothetical protein
VRGGSSSISVPWYLAVIEVYGGARVVLLKCLSMSDKLLRLLSLLARKLPCSLKIVSFLSIQQCASWHFHTRYVPVEFRRRSRGIGELSTQGCSQTVRIAPPLQQWRGPTAGLSHELNCVSCKEASKLEQYAKGKICFHAGVRSQ